MGKIVYAVVAVLVASMVLLASIPIYGSISAYTVEYDNEGGGDVRYNLLDSHGTFNITMDLVNDEIVAINGTDNQVMDNGQFFYTDNNFSVYLSETGDIVLTGKQADNTIATYLLVDTPVNVQRNGTGVIVTCGETSYNYGAPLYSYVPLSTGKYATYYDGTEITPSTSLKDAFIGNFAGVTAYNSMNDYNIDLVLDKTISEDGKLSGGAWIAGTPEESEEPFNPGAINPLDPSIINPFNPQPFDPITPDDPGDNVIMAVPTPTYTDGDWGYDLSNNKATIVSYSGTGGTNITIPATVGGYDVVKVGKGYNYQVFDNVITITNLIISEGIETINDYAFYNNPNINGTLTLPSTLTSIGKYAFRNCWFSGSLVIPEGVTTIGQQAFNSCSKFDGTLTLPSTLTSIGNYAFENCTKFTGSLVIPEGITILDSSTFAYCGFNGTLTLPSTLTRIGDNCFRSVHFTGTLTLPSALTILGENVFNGCTGFTGSLAIPEGVNRIDRQCFQNCSGFNGTLTLPSTLTSISDGVFSQCTGFTGSLVIPEGVTTIVQNAFKQCSGFNGTLTLPSTLTSIGNYAFSQCTNLTGELEIPEGVTTIGNDAFRYCTHFTGALVLPDSITSIGTTAFEECQRLNGIVSYLTDGATIGADAFRHTANVYQILNLGDMELTTTSYGLTAEEISDNIPVICFIGNTVYTATVTNEGVEYLLIDLLPLLSVVGLLLGAIILFLYKRV